MKEKEKKRVPQLRFPEFTDDWEQRKLEDYIVEYYEVTTENNQYPALTSSRKGIFYRLSILQEIKSHRRITQDTMLFPMDTSHIAICLMMKYFILTLMTLLKMA